VTGKLWRKNVRKTGKVLNKNVREREREREREKLSTRM